MINQDFWELGQILIDFPLSYQFIKELSIREEANEHSTLSLRLVADRPLGQEDVLRLSEVPIQIYTTGGICLYSGICVSAGLHSLNGYSEILVNAKSWSYQADIQKNSRTFQNPSKSLSEVVQTVLGSYGFALSLEKDIPIPIMLSQQNETDWQFVRRVANQFGFLVFADSKAENRRVSIGVVSFGEEELTESVNFGLLEKDISSFCRTKSGVAPGACAYEFLKQGCQTADISLGAGYTVRGGKSRQVVTRSEITARQGLLVNGVVLTYIDGAYPPAERRESASAGVEGWGGQLSASVSASSVVSGTVLAVSGTDVQVQFADGRAGGVRWIPYCSMIGNDFYCMPDEGDTVYCYYENDGTILCLGSRHVQTGSPDFAKPDEKVFTANNRMIRLKQDGVDITGNRPEMDGRGGDKIRITISDKEGIDISASKEVHIRADRTLLIQANDLDKVKQEPTEWFDSLKNERMERFDKEQTIGNDRYVADGGNDSYNAAWDLTKTVGGNLIKGFADDIMAPFQLISTLGGMISPPAQEQEQPKVSFEKVYEHQVMILGLQSCTLQVPGSCVRFAGESIIMSGPNFWWFGFARMSSYPKQSESQQTLMDSILDAFQLGIDLVGLIPGCNVVCGAINAGISLLRGDYYGAMSGLAGMLCPGGGLMTRGLGLLSNASETTKKVMKALKVLKAGALFTNAGLLGYQDGKEIIDQVKNGEFDITDPSDLALVTSLGRNIHTAFQSGKDIHDEVRPKKPRGDHIPHKESDDAGEPNKKTQNEKNKGESSKQKTENEVSCNDPIDVVTGSQKIIQTDMVVRDVAESFRLIRTYQSIHTNKGGLLGSKWYLNVESWITVEENTATVILPDMHLEHFDREDGGWVNQRNGDEAFRLKEDKDGYCLQIQKERKQYFYNRAGKLSRIVDRNENSIWFRYVGKTLMEITFEGGQRLKFTYEAGKVASISDVIGRTMQYRYDGELLMEAEYPNLGVVRYAYTPEGYLKTVTDQNGHTYVQNEYDLDGRVTRQLLSNGQEYVMLYDEGRRVNTFLTPSTGKRMEYHYNQERLLTKTVYTDGTFEERGYDSRQNLNFVRDRRGGELHRSFGEKGELLEERLPNGLVTWYTYDEMGNLLREWDNAGRDQEMRYDSRGNRTLFRAAIDEHRWQETSYIYDKRGRVLSTTDPRGGESLARYEKEGAGMVSYRTPEGFLWQYDYDEAGRCMAVRGEESRLDYAYNQMDCPVMVTDALGHTTKYKFDRLCNITKLVSPNQYDSRRGDGAGTEYIYDAMDELICRIDALGNIFATTRDLEENICKEIHPNSCDSRTKDGDGILYEYDVDDNRTKIRYPDGGTERIKYDAAGNITKKIAPEQYDEKSDDGPGYSYTYDCVNRLVQITDPEGCPVRRYVYDLRGNIIKEMDAAGCASAERDEERIGILYTYNALGWLTGRREPVEEAEGEIRYRLTEYEHDLAGNMTAEYRYLDFQSKDSRAGAVHTLTFAYDKDNRRTRVSDSTGAVVEYQYNSRNQCVRERRKVNETLFQIYRYVYDAAGRMVTAVSATETPEGVKDRSKTRYAYDKNGNCTWIQLPEGGEIRREYDAADRLIAEEHREKKSGIKNRTEFGYDKAGNLTEIRDLQGRKTVVEYDLCNREIRRRERDGSVTRRFYSGNGHLLCTVRPNQYDAAADDGRGYRYTYDLQGRVLAVVGPDGHVLQSNTYDPDGRLLRQQGAMETGIEFTYNLAGDRTQIRTAGGAAQELVFDARGNITGVADGNRNHTSYVLDDWGRIAEIKKPDGSTEQYVYDYDGNMVSSTDGEGHTTEYDYDGEGHVTTILDPMGGREAYRYDAQGRLAEKTDRNGVTTEYAFNLYGAPLYRRVKGGTAGDFYEYTPEGLLKSAISQTDTTGGMRYSYAYDSMDRLICKSASGRTLLAMAYDGNGNRIRQTDVAGKVTAYEFDDLDRTVKVWDDGREIAAYAYHADGTVKRESHGPLEKAYFYDADQNVTGIRIQSGASLLVDNQYQYDGNGNRTLKRQIGGEIRYHFDPCNQLKKVEYPSYSEELFYDRAGNRTRRVFDGAEELYQYDPRNRLTRLTRNGESTDFAYDAAGNLLRDGQAAYAYDGFNRTVKVETFDGNIQINRYDAEGLRHEMEENGKLVQFIFNPEQEVVTETGTESVRYIRTHELVASDAACARMYYHYASDEMGSITHLTDEDGEVQNRYVYDAWGNLTECEETAANRFQYAGEQCDRITRQYYLRARFYNPVIARFTQEDTYRGAGLNLYAYCANNPVYYVDPSGHQPSCVKDAAAKHMADGMSKEEAYKKAYAEHADQKLNDGSALPAQEREKLKRRAERLGMEVEPSANRQEAPRAETPKVGRQGESGTSSELKVIGTYDNNNYFTRAVEFNAGSEGTGFTYKVYQRNDIDWNIVRTTGAKKGRGLTNAQAAEKYGLAPILNDGYVATLHHSQQRSVGPLFEASTRYHNISNAKKGPLHPYKGQLNPFNPMDSNTRGLFQKVDSIEYWKARGRDAMKGVQ
ncbi:MAG: RHS repeat-associated core domain-containing protein [Roseburia sp.]